MKIEVCINRLEDLITVQSMKVDRVELCVEIGCGGLTPSIAFVEKALEISIIPIHVLVRPRSGHFFYTKEELDCIERDCLYFNSMGVAGIVTGMLTREMNLPLSFLQQLRDKLVNTRLVFHRAFDEVNKPEEALKELSCIGFDGVLTSGQYATAAAGIEVLSNWQKQMKNRVFILPGGGINAANCGLFTSHDFEWIHLSAKKREDTKLHSKFNHPTFGLDEAMIGKVISQLKKD